METPNDPKLSDRSPEPPVESTAARGEGAAPAGLGGGADAVTEPAKPEPCAETERQGCGSLQRMVRRCADSEFVVFEEVIRDGIWCSRHPETREVSVTPPISEMRQVIDETGTWVPMTEEHRERIAREREARLAAGLVPNVSQQA